MLRSRVMQSESRNSDGKNSNFQYLRPFLRQQASSSVHEKVKLLVAVDSLAYLRNKTRTMSAMSALWQCNDGSRANNV